MYAELRTSVLISRLPGVPKSSGEAGPLKPFKDHGLGVPSTLHQSLRLCNDFLELWIRQSLNDHFLWKKSAGGGLQSFCLK